MQDDLFPPDAPPSDAPPPDASPPKKKSKRAHAPPLKKKSLRKNLTPEEHTKVKAYYKKRYHDTKADDNKGRAPRHKNQLAKMTAEEKEKARLHKAELRAICTARKTPAGRQRDRDRNNELHRLRYKRIKIEKKEAADVLLSLSKGGRRTRKKT